MLFRLQDVQLHVGITQDIDAVTLAHVLLQVVHRVVDVRRRIRLIIAAVGVLYRNGGIHRKGCVKQTVIAPILMHLAGGERRIELQAVVQHALLAHKTCSVFFTSGNDIQAITFLIVQRQSEIPVLPRGVDGEILV